ncbi:MAG: 3-oxoacyl-ACP reductase FabG [Anaerolineales bacterium]|nr:3-oxoacyl-ACP reductase FabG [Anaerolineales bacterium]
MEEFSQTPQYNFKGKVALVTGGGSGLGTTLSQSFAYAGAKVAVNYRSSAVSADQLAAEINQSGYRAVAFQADVTDEVQVNDMVSRIVEQFGRLDILVNNAGIYPLAPFLEISPEQWDQVLNANLRSTFLVTQAVSRQMVAQGTGGAVVNIASIEGIHPAPGHSHYIAAKGGVIMLTKSLAAELGPHGIRVNAVSPGLIWREGLDQDWPDGVHRYQQAAPLKRLGYPEDIAGACLFLASSAASWITGINLVVDGGVLTNQIY